MSAAARAETGACLAWGELLWDRLGDRRSLGGAPANVAYHLAQLGRPVRLYSAVGDDEIGRRAVEKLKRARVDTQGVRVRDGLATAEAVVSLSGEGPRFEFPRRCVMDRLTAPSPVRAGELPVAALYFGTLAQRYAENRAALAETIVWCRKENADVSVVCDVNLRPPYVSSPAVELCFDHATVLKLSEDEARTLGGDDDSHQAVSRWFARHEQLAWIVVTNGSRGASVHTRRELVRVAAVEDPERLGLAAERDLVGSTSTGAVGAGDAFVAALLHRYLCGDPPEDAGKQACLYAGAVALQHGAMPKIPAKVLDAVAARVPT